MLSIKKVLCVGKIAMFPLPTGLFRNSGKVYTSVKIMSRVEHSEIPDTCQYVTLERTLI